MTRSVRSRDVSHSQRSAAFKHCTQGPRVEPAVPGWCRRPRIAHWGPVGAPTTNRTMKRRPGRRAAWWHVSAWRVGSKCGMIYKTRRVRHLPPPPNAAGERSELREHDDRRVVCWLLHPLGPPRSRAWRRTRPQTPPLLGAAPATSAGIARGLRVQPCGRLMPERPCDPGIAAGRACDRLGSLDCA